MKYIHFHLLFISLWIINSSHSSYAFLVEEDKNIYNRLEKFFEVKELAYNTHGWCSLIVALFLRTINLNTYEKKVLDVIQFKQRESNGNIKSYTENLIADSSSYYLSWITYIPDMPNVKGNLRGYYKNLQKKTYIQNYISDIKERMMFIKSQNPSINKGIITAFGYPSIENINGHATVLWLTSNNELVIIDPQMFSVTGKITLFIDSFIKDNEKNDYKNKNIMYESLYNYFENQLSLEDSATIILYKPHEKTYDDEDLSGSNPNIDPILKNINIARNSV